MTVSIQTSSTDAADQWVCFYNNWNNKFTNHLTKPWGLISLDKKYDYTAAGAFITEKAFTQGFDILLT